MASQNEECWLVREGGGDEAGEIFDEESDSGREGVASIDRRRVPCVAERLWIGAHKQWRADTLSNFVEEDPCAN